MLEIAQILAGLSVMLLFGALIAWAGPLGRAQFRRLNGSAVVDVANPQLAPLMLLMAVGVSGLAATLAIAELFGA